MNDGLVENESPVFARGVRQIVRFNYGYYLTSAVLIVGVLAFLICVPLPTGWSWMRWLVGLGLFLMIWWTVVSLVVSAWVYDFSEWPRGDWWQRLQREKKWRRILNIHTGFDETTVRLRKWSPEAQVISLDLFDPQRMTERSLVRARAINPPPPDRLVAQGAYWPTGCDDIEVVCLLFALHEYRTAGERLAIFYRLIKTQAREVIVVEHVRDLANFTAFGPGFMHFHSVATWQREWREAGWARLEEKRLTPFVRLWRLIRAGEERS